MPVICSRRIRLTHVDPGLHQAEQRHASAGSPAKIEMSQHRHGHRDQPGQADVLAQGHDDAADHGDRRVTNIMVADSSTSICTCCTSLVLRVISDGAPNWLSSRAEKASTRWKIAAADVPAEAHGGLGAEVDGGDRADDLDQADGEHDPAGAPDELGVAFGHAVVDDRPRSGWAGRATPWSR